MCNYLLEIMILIRQGVGSLSSLASQIVISLTLRRPCLTGGQMPQQPIACMGLQVPCTLNMQ